MRISDWSSDVCSSDLTARGETVDFVSRYFAPHAVIPEDPVTGSAHVVLTPFWSARLGKKILRARQVSARGGDLTVEDRGARTLISGKAAPYLEGRIRDRKSTRLNSSH